jgi:cellobiose phosphorylase
MRFDPCIPGAWEGYHVTFRHCGSVYEIQVDNPQGVNKGVKSVQIDGKVIDGDAVEFVGDGGEHSIRIILGLD